MDSPSLFAVLRPWLDGRNGPLVEQLDDALARFSYQRGLPIEEAGGRRVAAIPSDEVDETFAFDFVADHLITRLSFPLPRLRRLARLFASALRDAARRGAMPQEQVRRLLAVIDEAIAELPRLDALATALRRSIEEGRPGRELYRRDKAAYAAAMRAWQAELPVARRELEGGYFIRGIDDEGLRLAHPELPEEIVLPLGEGELARVGDRLDACLGEGRSGWFVVEVFAVAASRRD